MGSTGAPLPDLRRLRHFVTVAEIGSFTGAASRLHLSQQALSSSVRVLENEVGATLFAREGRRITLTPAGRALLDAGRPLLAAAAAVPDHVHAALVGARTWTVGHTPALSGEQVYRLIEPAVSAFPETSFTLRQLYPDQLTAAVADGSVHLGLRRGVAPAGDLAATVLGYDPIRVAVPNDHPMAGRDRIDITDLAGERLTLWAPPGASYFSDFLLGACRRAGFEPGYVVSRVQGAAMVAAPLTTNAVALVTADAGPAMGGRVRVIDLEPTLLVPVQGLWQRHTVSDIRDALIST